VQAPIPPEVAIEEIVVAPDAFQRLGAFAQRRAWAAALLLVDANTETAAGGRVAETLQDGGVRPARLRFERAELHPDEAAVQAARERIRADRPDGVVAVGSGTLTDIARYATHAEGRGFVSVPTAASMDGYASSVAAMELGGVKVTFAAAAPEAIFADPAVIAAAPRALTRAGLGDLLGKATARTDWLAAHLLYGEPFDPAAEARVLGPLRAAVTEADAILAGEPAAIEGLLHGLIQSGIAMAVVGSSRPASGCEHHASHFWDLLAARGERPHHSHGLQVGYATRFAIGLQRFAFAGGLPALRTPAPPPTRLDPDARRWLGDAPAIVEAMADKARFVADHADAWPDVLPAVGLADALAPFDEVARALDAAGLQARLGVVPGVDAATLDATFRYAGRLRARYTTLDFLEGQGALDSALDQVLPV
jgi:glycerol-1-phosphate dehydrogenase [NAD(P)+]